MPNWLLLRLWVAQGHTDKDKGVLERRKLLINTQFGELSCEEIYFFKLVLYRVEVLRKKIQFAILSLIVVVRRGKGRARSKPIC
jgi:hypothetical protein